MKEKLLLFAGASMFALAGTAVAGQPLKLSDAQLGRRFGQPSSPDSHPYAKFR